MNKKFTIFLIVIILIGAFLRVFPIRYGSVRMYDTQLITQAFDLGEGIIKGDFSVFKMPVKYPYFASYVLLFFYGIFYVFGRLIGLFSSSGQFINYIFSHLNGFYDFARILTGILGTLLIPLVYIVTKKIVSFTNKEQAKLAALFASLLMAFNLLQINISHQERPHVLVSFLVFLSFYAFIIYLEKKNLFSFLFLAVSAGLAAGSLQTGITALLFPFLIVLFSKFKVLSSPKFWLGVLIFVIIFVICYPYIFLSFGKVMEFWKGMYHLSVNQGGNSNGGLFFKETFKQIFVYQPVLVILFIVFLIWNFLIKKKEAVQSSLFKNGIIGAGLFIFVFISVFCFLIVPYRRMLSPLIPFFCFFVGIWFVEIFSNFKNKSAKKVFVGILILFLLFPLVQAIRFNYLLFQKETRDFAKNWIEENIPKSELIAIEHDHIRFTPDKKNIQLQAILEPESLSRKEKFLLSLRDELYPADSRAVLNYWVFKQGENRYEFLKNQGVKYFIVTKPTLRELSESKLELKIISEGGKLIKVFNPFIKSNSLSCSLFPDEFKNPITDLWTIKQMGPVIEIYKL